MLSLVENLLDHGRLDSNELSLQFSSINLSDFINSVVTMLRPIAEKKGLELRLDLKTSPDFMVSVDEVRVQQCLINLLNNAIKFTDSGWIQLIVNWSSDQLILDVIDTGIGMDDQELKLLCMPFWQSEKHLQVGTGLGMTITSRLIELMDGELSVRSELNRGTSIQMTIAAVIAEEHETIALSAHKQPDSDARVWKKILIVEDDSDIADLVALRLQEWGYEVEHCENGFLALEWLKLNYADMVLMDLDMPVMGGEEAVRKIREFGNETPIYIMSAKPLDIDGDTNLDAQGQLLKPVSFDLLRAVVADCLDC